MRSSLSRLLKVDYTDPDAARRARTLISLMLAAIVGLVIGALVVLPLGPTGVVSAIVLLLSAALLAVLVGVVRRGHLGLGVFLMSVVLMVIVVGQPLINGDMSTNPMLIPVGAMMLVYLLPPRLWFLALPWVGIAVLVLWFGTTDAQTPDLSRHLWLLNAAITALAGVFIAVTAAHQLVRALRREDALATQVSAHEAVVRRLQELASSDPLTGFRNRRALDEATIATAGAGAAALLDLDRFKAVNDQVSHAAGDSVLVGFSDEVARAALDDDLLFRIGGDEFLIIRPGADASDLGTWLGALRSALQRRQWPELPPGSPVTFSAGVVNCADLSIEAVLHRADDALYAAKEQGRDRIVVID